MLIIDFTDTDYSKIVINHFTFIETNVFIYLFFSTDYIKQTYKNQILAQK